MKINKEKRKWRHLLLSAPQSNTYKEGPFLSLSPHTHLANSPANLPKLAKRNAKIYMFIGRLKQSGTN